MTDWMAEAIVQQDELNQLRQLRLDSALIHPCYCSECVWRRAMEPDPYDRED